ncbi:hypothetical protein VNO77_12144 [Canavalia gladiata]|uniref:Protein kinase domain-containing protein n=1 Tax=Canavalia gladiata TaxID=3824 RepID=A0AAN9LZI8_CANGL
MAILEVASLLTWPIRMQIAIETATALAYMHASYLHCNRDVKTNNILLDINYSVKVVDKLDFGGFKIQRKEMMMLGSRTLNKWTGVKLDFFSELKEASVFTDRLLGSWLK